jgi:hypothetical protein
LEAFLDAVEPPVYFSFGSMRAPQDVSQAMIKAARAVLAGKRPIREGARVAGPSVSSATRRKVQPDYPRDALSTSNWL